MMANHQLAYKFDRNFSKSYFKQIVWLGGLVGCVLVLFWVLGHIPSLYHPEDFKESNLLFDVFYLLINPGYNTSDMSNGFILLIALTGMIVFCGLFISVVTNMLNRRVELFESGQISYKLNDHIVIIGYDNSVPALIHYLHSLPEYHGKSILLQTTSSVPEIRSILQTKLNSEEEERVIIYAGCQVLDDDLKQLQLEQCDRIYIVGDPSDSHDVLAMQCLAKISTILVSATERPLIPCYVQFTSLDAYNLLQYTDIAASTQKVLRFYPYNIEATWAHRVLVADNQANNDYYLPIDSAEGISTKSDKHVHIVIIGMNAMGEAIARQCAHIAHFPNFNQQEISTRTTITFIDPDTASKSSRLMAQMEGMFSLAYTRLADGTQAIDSVPWENPMNKGKYGYLGENFVDVKWEFIQGDTTMPVVRDYLETLAMDSTTLLSVFFVDTDSAFVLADATQLPNCLYTSPVVQQILVRQDESAAFVNLIQSANNSKFAKLRAFGQMDRFFSRTLIPEEFGKMVNAYYSGITDLNQTEQIDQLWQKTNTAGKWSSMHSANMRFVRMRSLGFDWQTRDWEHLRQLMDDQEESMMYVEHNRWVVDKLLSGFRALTKQEFDDVCANRVSKKTLKNAPYFAHLNICSMEQLTKGDPDAIDYDRVVLQGIPNMLEQEAKTN